MYAYDQAEQPPLGGYGYGYGSTEGPEQASGKKRRPFSESRRAMSLLGIVICLIVPCVIFTVVYALMSFTVHYKSPQLCHTVCIVLLVAVFLIGLLAFVAARMKSISVREKLWLVILFATSLTGWVIAYLIGELNYESNMHPYYDIQELNYYPSVDPSSYSGIQLMDAGRMTFVAGSQLDVSMSMGFKDLDTYCVAPVLGPAMANASSPSSIDLWAVGVNCCSGQGPDFHCGEYRNPHATSGLRLVREDQKSYFQLAVQQAEAAYNVRARHPIFLYWMQDPLAEVNAYQDDGQKYFLLGLFGFFLTQLLLVVVAAVLVHKLSP